MRGGQALLDALQALLAHQVGVGSSLGPFDDHAEQPKAAIRIGHAAARLVAEPQTAALGVAVELNASPDRLDLNDSHLMLARELGCRIVISTDSHRIDGFDVVRYGVATARRAWLSASQIANTRGWDDVAAMRPRLLRISRS